MAYLLMFLVLLVVFFFGFLWGIHDCKKHYGIVDAEMVSVENGNSNT